MTEPTRSVEEGLRTILIATDFSESGEAALERGCEIAKRRGASVVVAHVLATQALAIAGPTPVLLPPDIDEQLRAISRERLGKLCNAAREQGLDVEPLLINGSAGMQIVDAARERNSDLIVIGTRGLTGFKRVLLGSTAEHVVRRAHCPVLTVHIGQRHAPSAPRTVIIPTELRQDPSAAVDAVIRLLGRAEDSARIILVYSDHLPAHLQPFIEDLGIDRIGFDAIEQQLRDGLSPVAAKLARSGFEVETVIREGDPASVITELAAERSADLIAMQTHGRTGLAHLLLRSVAERVVAHAGCPVLTLRLKGEESLGESG